MLRSILVPLLVAASLVVSPAGASANEFSCDFRVTNVLVYAGGLVKILNPRAPRRDVNNAIIYDAAGAPVFGNYTTICSVEATWKGVAAPTCMMWVALLEKSKANGGIASIYYRDDTLTKCEELPHYDLAPAPLYIGDMSP
jgi:hypothetical protein